MPRSPCLGILTQTLHIVASMQDQHARRPCPYDNYPGPNATIPYPCPGGFQFPVTGDFGVEDYLGTANLPLKESIAEAGAAVHSAKCNAALTGMLPCDEQLLV